MTPSTDWKELIAPNEGPDFELMAAQLGAQQKARAEKAQVRRALHAKSNVLAHGTFEVLPDLPAHARVGLFAEPKRYQAVVRFSNGTGRVQDDKKPDVRGIGVKLLAVGGAKLIPGMESAPTQDFLGILAPSVPFRTPEEFVWFVLRAGNPLTLIPKAFAHLGFGRAARLLGTLQKGLSQPVHSLAMNTYFSALPIRFGSLAAKFSFEPHNPASEGTPPDLGLELTQRLENGGLGWHFKVQFYTDERSTPIEDPTVEWTSPWTTLAHLSLPRQSLSSERGQRYSQWAETLSFDPWHAQQELRPLGAMMRARAPAYRISNQVRGAAGEPAALPTELP